MKATTIGGGSTYSPGLVQGFVERQEQLGLHELWLMDIGPRRLSIIGGFVRRMVAAAGAPLQA